MLAPGGAERSHMALYGIIDLVAMCGLIAVAKKIFIYFIIKKLKSPFKLDFLESESDLMESYPVIRSTWINYKNSKNIDF